jgi:hypothetical protein
MVRSSGSSANNKWKPLIYYPLWSTVRLSVL